jgi:phosphomannomutase
VEGVESGRVFVRPSGTEDVVRVYAGTCRQRRGREGARSVIMRRGLF